MCNCNNVRYNVVGCVAIRIKYAYLAQFFHRQFLAHPSFVNFFFSPSFNANDEKLLPFFRVRTVHHAKLVVFLSRIVLSLETLLRMPNHVFGYAKTKMAFFAVVFFSPRPIVESKKENYEYKNEYRCITFYNKKITLIFLHSFSFSLGVRDDSSFC